jgi:hypothetical protein
MNLYEYERRKQPLPRLRWVILCYTTNLEELTFFLDALARLRASIELPVEYLSPLFDPINGVLLLHYHAARALWSDLANCVTVATDRSEIAVSTINLQTMDFALFESPPRGRRQRQHQQQHTPESYRQARFLIMRHRLRSGKIRTLAWFQHQFGYLQIENADVSFAEKVCGSLRSSRMVNGTTTTFVDKDLFEILIRSSSSSSSPTTTTAVVSSHIEEIEIAIHPLTCVHLLTGTPFFGDSNGNGGLNITKGFFKGRDTLLFDLNHMSLYPMYTEVAVDFPDGEKDFLTIETSDLTIDDAMRMAVREVLRVESQIPPFTAISDMQNNKLLIQFMPKVRRLVVEPELNDDEFEAMLATPN